MREYEPLDELDEHKLWWEDPNRVGSLAATIVVLGIVATVVIIFLLFVAKGVSSLLW